MKVKCDENNQNQDNILKYAKVVYADQSQTNTQLLIMNTRSLNIFNKTAGNVMDSWTNVNRDCTEKPVDTNDLNVQCALILTCVLFV